MIYTWPRIPALYIGEQKNKHVSCEIENLVETHRACSSCVWYCTVVLPSRVLGVSYGLVQGIQQQSVYDEHQSCRVQGVGVTRTRYLYIYLRVYMDSSRIHIPHMRKTRPASEAAEASERVYSGNRRPSALLKRWFNPHLHQALSTGTTAVYSGQPALQRKYCQYY